MWIGTTVIPEGGQAQEHLDEGRRTCMLIPQSASTLFPVRWTSLPRFGVNDSAQQGNAHGASLYKAPRTFPVFLSFLFLFLFFSFFFFSLWIHASQGGELWRRIYTEHRLQINRVRNRSLNGSSRSIYRSIHRRRALQLFPPNFSNSDFVDVNDVLRNTNKLTRLTGATD